jgi:pimeloyl-ACP methyl ester carboxylesterase
MIGRIAIGQSGISVVKWTTVAVVLSLGVTTLAQNAVPGKRPESLILAEQGSFFVGGSIQFRDPNSSVAGETRQVPGDIAVGHMFVQYQIPERQTYRYPVVMLHGGGHTGKTYETTPDGREGWFTTFARRGFSPYVIDAPNRGRSGYDPTHRYKASLGLEPASAMEVGNIYSAQAAWVAFRFGPTYGDQYPGQQFPVEHLNDYVKQLVPSYRDPAQNPLIVSALVALIDKIGPCILIGHSTGGANVLNAAAERPEMVKGLVALEPSGYPPEDRYSQLARMPLVVVLGDHRPAADVADTRTITARLKSLGGDASTVVLPEVGIHGNGHMMMMERNSEQVAGLVEGWIKQHVGGIQVQ